MDLFSSAAVIWLLNQVGSALFDAAKDALLKGMGLVSSTIPPTQDSAQSLLDQAQSLLDQYVQRLEQEIKMVGTKIDEDRLALLEGAFCQIRKVNLTNARNNVLALALNNFHTIASLPQEGTTGTWRVLFIWRR